MTAVINKFGQPVHATVSTLGEVLNKARSPHRDYTFDKAALNSQVLIIEGISGAGKDTLQTYFKKKLSRRVVHDYSEGEVLHSWKQSQIDGIFDVRIQFMKLFVNYIEDVVNRDKTAVFLLNRFHLSTYAWRVIQQQELGPIYEEIITVLKRLPVHIFILHVDENEIERRSLHRERSTAWRKFQRQILENRSFFDRLRIQQKLILEAAENQQIPYSVIKLDTAIPEIVEDAPVRIFEKLAVPSVSRRQILDKHAYVGETTKLRDKLPTKTTKQSRKLKERSFSNSRGNGDGSHG